jgi:hypothetical protein
LHKKNLAILKIPAPTNRITNVQATVVPKSNYGTIRQRGCNPCRAPFLVLFWRNKKEQEKKLLAKTNSFTPSQLNTTISPKWD